MSSHISDRTSFCNITDETSTLIQLRWRKKIIHSQKSIIYLVHLAHLYSFVFLYILRFWLTFRCRKEFEENNVRRHFLSIFLVYFKCQTKGSKTIVALNGLREVMIKKDIRKYGFCPKGGGGGQHQIQTFF